jgi:hypothetical protein
MHLEPLYCSAGNYDSGKVRGRRTISFIFFHLYLHILIRTPAIPLNFPTPFKLIIVDGVLDGGGDKQAQPLFALPANHPTMNSSSVAHWKKESGEGGR